MNQIFSFNRFRLLLTKYIRDNRQSLVGAAAIVLAFHVLGGLFIIFNSFPNDFMVGRNQVFYMVSLPFWGFFTWHQANEYNKREKAMSLLLIPASQVEKSVVIWFITGFCFQSWFLLNFYFMDLIGTYTINHKVWSQEELSQIRRQQVILPIKTFDITTTFRNYFILLVHPLVLVSTMFFKRYTVIFSLLVAFTIFFGVIFINQLVFDYLTGEIIFHFRFPFESVSVRQSSSSTLREVDIPQQTSLLIRWSVASMLAILWYAAAYFRLKEREV